MVREVWEGEGKECEVEKAKVKVINTRMPPLALWFQSMPLQLMEITSAVFLKIFKMKS